MIQLINDDALIALTKLEENSIDLTVTSPPYDNLRTYNGNNAQWGEPVWRSIIEELYTVTKVAGVVVWVVGDATIKGSETGTSFKQALWAMECGFKLHDTMIWGKTNPPPQTKEGRRYTLAHEYMFILSKGKPKTFNPIMQDCKMAGAETNNRTQRSPDGGIRKDRSEARKGTVVNKQKPLQSICSYANTGGISHPAVFPEKLAEDHILSWSNEGDTVLDPMCGSGTTLKMAKKNNRNYIGIEISQEYCKIAEARIKGE